jgi:hypothetical protein
MKWHGPFASIGEQLELKGKLGTMIELYNKLRTTEREREAHLATIQAQEAALYRMRFRNNVVL